MLRCGTESYRTKAIGLSDHPKWMEFGSIFIQDVSPTNCPDLEIKLKDVKSKELGRYVCKNSFEWPIYKICDLEIWISVLENMSIPIQPSMSDVRVRQFFCYLIIRLIIKKSYLSYMASAFIMRNIDWIDGSKLTLPGGGAEKAPP